MNIVLGLILIALGVVLVMKTEWFMQNIGAISWFEEKFGSSGGSRLGYKLLGILLLVLGIIFATGSGDSFMGWATGPITKYNQ